MIKDITSEDLEEMLEKDKKVFVDFHANWCGPCKMVEPILKDLSIIFEKDIDFVKINIDEEPQYLHFSYLKKRQFYLNIQVLHRSPFLNKSFEMS